MLILLFFPFIIFLLIGSFLNATAHRVTFDKPLFRSRSHCLKCDKIIAWYDNVPVISWILLKGKCRSCKNKISLLYPFIEILTAIVMTILFIQIFDPYLLQNFQISSYDFSFFKIGRFSAYFIFFSTLIMSTRSDLEALVIPQIFTLWLIPLGILSSLLNFLDINFVDSILGATLGYTILWAIAKMFKKFTSKDGLGCGDMELLALIGSFLGPLGVWSTLMVASIIGLIIGGGYLVFFGKSHNTRIPFGPFLALGAFLSFFFRHQISYFFFS